MPIQLRKPAAGAGLRISRLKVETRSGEEIEEPANGPELQDGDVVAPPKMT